jgi:ornithine cyclodeaminase/alanine dehydrogenase-like protein (mu-crystallin family)
MKILTEAELRGIVPLDREAVACVEDAFRALATKAVAMPPILRLDIPEHRGEVDVKTAYVPGLDGFAIKISPGFFDNPKIGLPSTNGMMVLLSSKTGLVQALLLDNGYLTDVRTAAAGAVAARRLSREDSSVAAVFGAGMQARLQLEALALVRPIREARIWARDAAMAGSSALRSRPKPIRERPSLAPISSLPQRRPGRRSSKPNGSSRGSTSPPWVRTLNTRTRSIRTRSPVRLTSPTASNRRAGSESCITRLPLISCRRRPSSPNSAR